MYLASNPGRSRHSGTSKIGSAHSGRKKTMTSVKVLITAVVSIIIQFALAIAGWGGWSRFFAHSAFKALGVATVVLSVLAIPSGGGKELNSRRPMSPHWESMRAFCMARYVVRELDTTGRLADDST